MKKLVVDIDGVICQYDFPKIIKKHFGVAIPEDWICCYSIEESLGLPTEDVHKMFEAEVFSEPLLLLGAVDSLKMLMAKGYQIGILSNRQKFMTSTQLEAWLDKYNIPWSQIYNCTNLPDYVYAMVDDSVSKLLEVDSKIKVGKLLLFVQPWNFRCHDLLGKFKWVNSWSQVLKEIDGDI